MDKIRFLGRTTPPACKVSLADIPVIHGYQDEALAYLIDVAVRVEPSLVEVEMSLPAYDQRDFERLYQRAQDIVRATVDLAAFAAGARVVAVLERFVDPQGKEIELGERNNRLAAECSAFSLGTDPRIWDVWRVAINDHQFFMALRDLVDANMVGHEIPTNCGRVLDSIRRMIFPAGPDKKRQGWLAMQAALNVSSDYQKWVTEMSAPPRHGDRSYINAADTQELLRRTWAIMNRFMVYRTGGNKPLTAPDFPLLDR